MNKSGRYRQISSPATPEFVFCQPLNVLHYPLAAGLHPIETSGVKMVATINQLAELVLVSVRTIVTF